jgi:hypothetical protein
LTIDPTIGAALRLAFALLFLGAALHKVRDVARFRAAVAAYDLLPRAAIGAAAVVVIAVEVAIGVGLLIPAAAGRAALLGMGLLGLYAVAIAINLRRGHEIRCGCGGLGGERPIAPALVGRNLLLVGLLGLTLLPLTSRPLEWLDLASIAFSVATAALLYLAADVAIANAEPLRRLVGGRGTQGALGRSG